MKNNNLLLLTKNPNIPSHDKFESIQLRSLFLSNNLPLHWEIISILPNFLQRHPQSKSYPKMKSLKVHIFFNWPDPLYVAFVGKQSSIILWQVFVQHTRIVLRSHFVRIYLEKMKIWINPKIFLKISDLFLFHLFPALQCTNLRKYCFLLKLRTKFGRKYLVYIQLSVLKQSNFAK